MKKRLPYLFLFVLLVTGCRRWTTEPAAPLPLRNATLTELRAASGVYMVYGVDAVIVGRITTTDREGCFSRSVFIDDGTCGAELLTGIWKSYETYPCGERIAVRVRGLAGVVEGGILRLGLPAAKGQVQRPQYFEHRVAVERYVQISTDVSAVAPVVRQADAVTDNDLGRLVEIHSLRADSVVRWGGTHALCTDHGTTVYTEVASEASFAADSIPRKQLSISGIAVRSGTAVKLRLRDLGDVR